MPIILNFLIVRVLILAAGLGGYRAQIARLKRGSAAASIDAGPAGTESRSVAAPPSPV